MSLRHEQYAALKATREFLRWLLTEKGRFTKGELRDRAYRCLKHYPFLCDNGKPMFSQDEFSDDKDNGNSNKG